MKPWRTLGSALLLVGTFVPLSLLATDARAQDGTTPLCDSCQAVADPCGAGQPSYADTAFTNYFVYADRLVAGTAWGLTPQDPVLGVFDLGLPRPVIAPNTNWYAPAFYGPTNSWNMQNLGSIFGLTFDSYGNIFVTHTAAYSVYSAPGIPADMLGPGGAGAIYKISNGTGAISLVCNLPNYQDPALPGHPASDQYPGLGNITWDPVNQQLFVTNMEDGRIYRISPTGTILSTFDPGASDPGPTNPSTLPPAAAIGAAPLGERLWAVKWHGGRVYYSRWFRDFGHQTANPNEVRSVGLNGTGDFNGWDDRLEVKLPVINTANFSNPVSDLAFNTKGDMLVAERGMVDITTTVAHQSRLLEYKCLNFQWVAEPLTKFHGGTVAPKSCAGGCDYDQAPFSTSGTDPYGRTWGSWDALFASAPPWIYGLEASPPTGGNILNSYTIDFDLNVGSHDKQLIGDVAIPCPPSDHGGGLGGTKYYDFNHNGVQEGTEPGLAGWQITITGPVNFTATTDGAGNFSFGSLPPGTYTICEVTQPGWVVTQPAGGCYSITLGPGQTINNLNFGNHICHDDQPCVTPPTCTVGWWTFDENTGTLINDVASNNDGGVAGGAAWVGGQYVNNALSFISNTQFAQVNPINPGVLAFGTGDFSVDAWIQMNAPTATERTIIDRRQGPAATERGYRLYARNSRLAFEMGVGAGPNVFFNAGGPIIIDGAWHHVAATVCRSTAGVNGSVNLYVDGVLVQTFGGVPTGSVNVPNTTPIRFGQQCPGFPTNVPFEGRIDEPEIFKCCLTAAQVNQLWAAKTHGKCRDFCYVPSITTVAPLATTAVVNATIYNAATYPQTFSWTMSGLPAGGSCTVNGPTLFAPMSGTVTVPATTWTTIAVTVTLPGGMTTSDRACYELTVLNGTKYSCCTSQGAIQKKKVWFPNPTLGALQDSVVAQLMFTGHNTDPAALDLDVSVRDQPVSLDNGDAAVRLNGLPPGVPWLGSYSVAPGPGSVNPLDVAAMDVNYQAFLVHEIILSGDLDGDGVPEDLAAIPVISSLPGSQGAVGEPAPFEAMTQLMASPNPFRTKTAVNLTLSQGQGATVGVFDVSGRLIRRVFDGQLPAGSHAFEWDGHDDSGSEVQQGIYFIRVRSAGKVLSTKVVRLN